MEEQTLYIDDMVCYRCILAVERVLKKSGWTILDIELGRVRAAPPAEESTLEEVAKDLSAIGLNLRKDGYDLITRIKGLIIQYVYDDVVSTDMPLSEIIVRDVTLSYSYLSRHFSRKEQRTIEEFYQLHRIERAKRILFQTTISMKEVAQRLKYKSAGHFSASFRKGTGETPSDFRAKGEYTPQPIDKL
jgi:AraC-like DNA-binding protein